jgi:hypothetical protein
MIEYSLISEVYGKNYIDTSSMRLGLDLNKNNSEEFLPYPHDIILTRSGKLIKNNELKLLPNLVNPAQEDLQDALDMENVICTHGGKLRITNGKLQVDKRSGIRRFLSRDGRTKTLKFLENACNIQALPYDVISVYIRILKHIYCKDTLFINKVNDLKEKNDVFLTEPPAYE